MDEAEARLRDIERFRVSQREAEEWVDQLVLDAAAIGDLMRSGSVAEQRAILRGITQEIVLDPENGRGEVAFYGIPQVTIGASGQTKRTSPEGDVLSVRVAGGRNIAEERTSDGRIWRKSFCIGRGCIAA